MIREATISDASELTKIAFSSKRYWNYPETYFDVWAKELTITGEYIKKNLVYTFVKENGWDTFKILSDPNAKDFYIKQGCRYLKEIPSSIEGRTTPLLEYRVK